MTTPQSRLPNSRHEECVYFANGRCILHSINVDAKGDACAYFRPWKEESSSPEGVIPFPVPGAPIVATSDVWLRHGNQGNFAFFHRSYVPRRYWHRRHGQGFARRGAGPRHGRRGRR